VHPSDDAKKQKLGTWALVLKNLAMAASGPLFYVWLPLSCCFVMPTAKYASTQVEKAVEAGEPAIVCINLSAGMVGMMSCLSCACCCGCCGTLDPDDM